MTVGHSTDGRWSQFSIVYFNQSINRYRQTHSRQRYRVQHNKKEVCHGYGKEAEGKMDIRRWMSTGSWQPRAPLTSCWRAWREAGPPGSRAGWDPTRLPWNLGHLRTENAPWRALPSAGVCRRDDGESVQRDRLSGYDNHTRKYVSTWMDSMSTGIMVFEGTAGADGKTITQTADYDDPVQGPMQWRSVTRGSWMDKTLCSKCTAPARAAKRRR